MKLETIACWMMCAQLMGCAAEVIDAAAEEEVGVTREALAFEDEYLVLDRQGRALTKPSGNDTPSMTAPSTSSVSSRAFGLRKSSGAGSDFADGQIIRLFHGAASDDDFLRYAGAGAALTLGVAGAHTNWTADEVGAGAGSEIDVGDVFRLRTSVDTPTLNLRSVNGGLVADTVNDAATHEFHLGCSFPRGGFAGNWAIRPTFTAVANPLNGFKISNAVSWIVRHLVSYELPTGAGTLVAWDDFSFTPERDVAFVMTDTLWAGYAIAPYDSLGLSGSMKTTLVRLGWNGDGLRDALFHGLELTRHLKVDSDLDHGELLGRCAGTDISGGHRVTEVRAMNFSFEPVANANNPTLFVDSAVYEALNRFWNGDRNGAIAMIQTIVAKANANDSMFWDSAKNELVDAASVGDFGNGGTYAGTPFKIALVLYAAKILGGNAVSAAVQDKMRIRLREAQISDANGADDGGMPHVAFYDANGTFLSGTPPTAESTAIAILAHTVNAVP